MHTNPVRLLLVLLAASLAIVRPASAQSARPLNPDGVAEFPRFSPDGTRIAFQTNRDGNWEIYVVDVGGGEAVRLTRNLYDDVYPSWSPDGTQIVYSSKDTGYGPATASMSAIFVMDADGGARRRLTNTEAGADMPGPLYNDSAPVWSPDGARIAFLSDRVNSFREIFLMNADGSGLRQVTFRNNHHWNLAWTADSTRLVYDGRQDPFPIANNNPVWGMYSIAVSGSPYGWGDDLRVLRNEMSSALEYDSALSPDGERIVFLLGQADPALRETQSGVAMARLDTRDGGLSVIEDTIEILEGARGYWYNWSPDSRRLTFVSGRDGHPEIYVMDADGGNVERVTTSR